MSRVKNIKKASWVGVVGNAILSFLKIVIGFLSGSLAVVGDGIDSATDILTSLLTLWVARIIEKPPDAMHPYGHGRAETIATRIVSFIIFYAGLQLGLSSVQSILSGTESVLPSTLAIYVTVLSIAAKLFLAYYKFKVGKKEKSSMLIADSKNMRNDVVLSIAVLAGLFLAHLLNFPVLDKYVALAVSAWIIKVAVEIFFDENTELMEGVAETDTYNEIFNAVRNVKGAQNPHRARIRKIGNFIVIDLDIEVDGSFTVSEGHAIAKTVEAEIKKDVDNVYDVLIHVEPLGNVEKDEKYGVSYNDH